jgi:hypothetical protein
MLAQLGFGFSILPQLGQVEPALQCDDRSVGIQLGCLVQIFQGAAWLAVETVGPRAIQEQIRAVGVFVEEFGQALDVVMRSGVRNGTRG